MSDDPNGQDTVNPCLCIIVDRRVGKKKSNQQIDEMKVVCSYVVKH